MNNIHRISTYRASKSLLDNYFLNKFVIEINLENDPHLASYLETIVTNKDYINYYKCVKPEYKYDYVSMLVLYYLGGFVINDKITLLNENITDNNEIVCVKSFVHDNLFTGFIYAKKNNPIILATINDFIIKKQEQSINEIIYKKILNEIVVKKVNNIQILEETIQNSIATILHQTTEVAKHYFAIESLELLNFKPKENLDLKKLKIGITFDVPKNIHDFYCNGIRQNAIYFFELLDNMGYDAKLIIDNKQVENITNIQKDIDFYTYKYTIIENMFYEEFDVVVSFGFSIVPNLLYLLKKTNVKVIFYQCGNSYLINTERILYNQHDNMVCDGYVTSFDKNRTCDQIWSIPQMYKQNKGFWEILNRSNCIEVPFIWSNNSIKFVKKILNLQNEGEMMYKKKENKIGIFEPNISVMKWCLPCLFICEKSYRDKKNISHVYVTNMDIKKKPDEFKINKFNNEQFNNICKHLEINTNKKLSVEHRYITLEFMMKYADIAVSHQWENPLNYLYLDLAWMGWPILHNAYLCKDVGYYYSEFDYDEASKQLNYIIENHELEKDKYLKNNRNIIDRYLPTNINLQNSYRKLFEDLFI